MNDQLIKEPTCVTWVGKTEIAEHFKCSVRHVNNLMQRRVLPYTKIGRFVRFNVQACDEAMKRIGTKSIFD